MAKKYSALHLGSFTDEDLAKAKNAKERTKICEKRLTTGWFTYALLEMKQRFRIAGPISSNIDHALAEYHLQVRDGFYLFWGKHKCDKPGCGWVFVVDGGMKAQRKICGALKSGVRVYEHSKTTLVTGCTTHPGDHRYCSAHKDIINLEYAEVPSATERNCNTRKDRDKRKNRHTCGIFLWVLALRCVSSLRRALWI